MNAIGNCPWCGGETRQRTKTKTPQAGACGGSPYHLPRACWGYAAGLRAS